LRNLLILFESADVALSGEHGLSEAGHVLRARVLGFVHLAVLDDLLPRVFGLFVFFSEFVVGPFLLFVRFSLLVYLAASFLVPIVQGSLGSGSSVLLEFHFLRLSFSQFFHSVCLFLLHSSQLLPFFVVKSIFSLVYP